MEKTIEWKNSFQTEQGGCLDELQVRYYLSEPSNIKNKPVVWICHALTASANAADWWPGMVGPGKLFDPQNYFIVCANIPGSCYGTTGPLSYRSAGKKRYYRDFPLLTIRDVVGVLELLRSHLKISSIHTLIGGSLGGQTALEWSIHSPGLLQHLVLLATNARHSAWGVAFNETQRMAIEMDPKWQEESEDAGLEGMKVARATALLSYRSYHTYLHTQSEQNSGNLGALRASSYQRYQGEKLASRFNAFSYWHLTKMMDSHDIGRNRGPAEEVLGWVRAKTLIIGISSDLLFPTEEQIFLAKHIPNADYAEIESLYGHDGFLIETDAITQVIRQFYLKNPNHTNN